ncbi:MAG: hypothetical protein K9W46_09155 [Candidatus Heimdallarchaeum endolithica]|uniref:Uncharacterized protein n=1 Tax=Candidatus Heimdallarchaeum endolithica TaxID=2876572 RepID=A0A9Y1BP01_9ARCH|nr:MAG: hypothetical protein K9W46_09155 [Candidatus Heimdallarchaeum endolithica]
MHKDELADIINVYLKARKDFLELVGETPENYRILIFLNPDLHISVNRVIESAGTPQAILTAEEVVHLQSARNNEYMPLGKETVFNSIPTLIYLSTPRYELTEEEKLTLRIMLVHAFAHAYMNEKTESNNPRQLSRIYQLDVILKELFQNNAYKINEETNKQLMWTWQYYQDLISVIRLFVEAGVQDFYSPPEEARKYTLFNNFSIEVIKVLKERAKESRKKHLHDLIDEGFAFYIQRMHLDYLNKNKQVPKNLPKELKPFMAPPVGKISLFLVDKLKLAISEQIEKEKKESLSSEEIEKRLFDKLFSFRTDLEFLETFDWQELKNWVSEQKRAHSEKVLKDWHVTTTNFTDIWSVYAYGWTQLENYIKKIYRKKYSTFGQLMDDNPKIEFKGYLTVDEKKVYVFEINNEGVGLDQLVILHNHMALYREDFATILPAFADIIAFKKIRGMHVATLFAVHKISRKQPISPYNLPIVTRAVQVTKRKDAYKTELDEEKEKMEVERVDYTHLKKLSQPQRNAISYLIKEGMYYV